MLKKSFALLLCLGLCLIMLPLTAQAGSAGHKDLIATLGTGAPSYSAGAPVTFHASLFNPTGYPVGNIKAELILPEGFRFLSGDGATAFSLAAGETKYWQIEAVQGSGVPATGDSGAAIFWLLIPAALFTAVLVFSMRRKTRFLALAVCATLLLGSALPSALAATTQESFSVDESFIIGGATQTATLNIRFDYSYAEEDPIKSMTFSYTGQAMPIPDASDLSGANPGAEAVAPLTVSGVSRPIQKVVLSIDGTESTANAGATTVGIDHTFVNDLEVSLRSPAGTRILMIGNTDGGGNNFSMTVLDDDAASSIQNVVTAQAPFTGTFRPYNPLAGFIGEDANGDWQLIVQDFFSQDIGNIRAFTVTIYY